MPDTILAIDLGKYKCVACAYDRRTTAAVYRLSITHNVPSPVGPNSATLWYYGPCPARE